jgi:hypothetical protein
MIVGELGEVLACGRCGRAPDQQYGHGVFWFECRCGISGPAASELGVARQEWDEQQRRYQRGARRMLSYAWTTRVARRTR